MRSPLGLGSSCRKACSRPFLSLQDNDAVWVNDFDTSIIPHTDVVAIGAEVRDEVRHIIPAACVTCLR